MKKGIYTKKWQFDENDETGPVDVKLYLPTPKEYNETVLTWSVFKDRASDDAEFVRVWDMSFQNDHKGHAWVDWYKDQITEFVKKFWHEDNKKTVDEFLKILFEDDDNASTYFFGETDSNGKVLKEGLKQKVKSFRLP